MQHFGLPQIFHGRYEEKTPVLIEEKSLIFVHSGDVQEEKATEAAVNDIGEALSHEREQIDEGQRLYEVPDDSVVSQETVEIIEGHFDKSSPEPPVLSDEIPAVLEYNSRQQETPGEEIRPLSDLGLEKSFSSEEIQQNQALPAEEAEPEDQSVVETLVDAVKDKVSAVKDYLFDEANDVRKKATKPWIKQVTEARRYS